MILCDHTVHVFPTNYTDAVIGFTPNSYAVNEEGGTVTLTVSVISGMLQRPVEIGFSTANDTAIGMVILLYRKGTEGGGSGDALHHLFLFIAGFDYVAVIDHMLNFNATSSSNEVTVNISSDALLEIDEQFLGHLTLISTDANVIVSPAEATVTITDDDGMFHGISKCILSCMFVTYPCSDYLT